MYTIPQNQELRGKLEKIAWKHYDPQLSINVEEMLDEMMPILVSHHNKVLEEIIEEVDKKRDWFKKATGGQLDSSLYADGVVACCNDLKSLLHQKLIK